MTRDEIEQAICEIMWRHGPDGHVDGYEQLTDFVMEQIAAERERCAKIAEEISKTAQPSDDEGELIAAAIRKGTP